MVNKSLLELSLGYLSSKSEKKEIAYNLRHSEHLNSLFHYRAQTIYQLKIVWLWRLHSLEQSLVAQGKLTPLENSNVEVL